MHPAVEPHPQVDAHPEGGAHPGGQDNVPDIQANPAPAPQNEPIPDAVNAPEETLFESLQGIPGILQNED